MPVDNNDKKPSSLSVAPEHLGNKGKPLDESTVYPSEHLGPAREVIANQTPQVLPLTISASDFAEVTHEWASLFEAPEKRIVTAKRAGELMSPAEAEEQILEWRRHASAQRGKAGVNNGQKTIISLFDLSGEWSKPWRDAGYNVLQFDIQSGQDIHDFSVEYFNENYDIGEVYGVLAACPCTDFAVSGARHFAGKDADGRTEASKELVMQTLRTIEFFRPKFWVLENPVGRIERLTGLPPARMTFDPNHFGADYTKKTMLWGKFDPSLPTAHVEATEGSKMHRLYGGKSLATKNARSETPEGFAFAFFMANNYEDLAPRARLEGDFPETSGAVTTAFDRGLTEAEIRDLVQTTYENYEYEDVLSILAEALQPIEEARAQLPVGAELKRLGDEEEELLWTVETIDGESLDGEGFSTPNEAVTTLTQKLTGGEIMDGLFDAQEEKTVVRDNPLPVAIMASQSVKHVLVRCEDKELLGDLLVDHKARFIKKENGWRIPKDAEGVVNAIFAKDPRYDLENGYRREVELFEGAEFFSPKENRLFRVTEFRDMGVPNKTARVSLLDVATEGAYIVVNTSYSLSLLEDGVGITVTNMADITSGKLMEHSQDDVRGLAFAIARDGEMIISGSVPMLGDPQDETSQYNYYRNLAEEAGGDLYFSPSIDSTRGSEQDFDYLIGGLTWAEIDSLQQKEKIDRSVTSSMPEGAVLVYSSLHDADFKRNGDRPADDRVNPDVSEPASLVVVSKTEAGEPDPVRILSMRPYHLLGAGIEGSTVYESTSVGDRVLVTSAGVVEYEPMLLKRNNWEPVPNREDKFKPHSELNSFKSSVQDQPKNIISLFKAGKEDPEITYDETQKMLGNVGLKEDLSLFTKYVNTLARHKILEERGVDPFTLKRVINEADSILEEMAEGRALNMARIEGVVSIAIDRIVAIENESNEAIAKLAEEGKNTSLFIKIYEDNFENKPTLQDVIDADTALVQAIAPDLLEKLIDRESRVTNSRLMIAHLALVKAYGSAEQVASTQDKVESWVAENIGVEDVVLLKQPAWVKDEFDAFMDASKENRRKAIIPVEINRLQVEIKEYTGLSPIPRDNKKRLIKELSKEYAELTEDIDAIELVEEDIKKYESVGSYTEYSEYLSEKYQLSYAGATLLTERYQAFSRDQAQNTHDQKPQVQLVSGLASQLSNYFEAVEVKTEPGYTYVKLPAGSGQISMVQPKELEGGRWEVSYSYQPSDSSYLNRTSTADRFTYAAMPTKEQLFEDIKEIKSYFDGGVIYSKPSKAPVFGEKDGELEDKYSTTAICKAIRADIKQAIKEKILPNGLKVGVRKTGSSSLSVTVKEVPEGFKVYAEQWLRLDEEDRRDVVSRSSEEAAALMDTLSGIVNAYNYDDSDTMTDYHNRNYYENITFEDRQDLLEKELSELEDKADVPTFNFKDQSKEFHDAYWSLDALGVARIGNRIVSLKNPDRGGDIAYFQSESGSLFKEVNRDLDEAPLTSIAQAKYIAAQWVSGMNVGLDVVVAQASSVTEELAEQSKAEADATPKAEEQRTIFDLNPDMNQDLVEETNNIMAQFEEVMSLYEEKGRTEHSDYSHMQEMLAGMRQTIADGDGLNDIPSQAEVDIFLDRKRKTVGKLATIEQVNKINEKVALKRRDREEEFKESGSFVNPITSTEDFFKAFLLTEKEQEQFMVIADAMPDFSDRVIERAEVYREFVLAHEVWDKTLIHRLNTVKDAVMSPSTELVNYLPYKSEQILNTKKHQQYARTRLGNIGKVEVDYLGYESNPTPHLQEDAPRIVVAHAAPGLRPYEQLTTLPETLVREIAEEIEIDAEAKDLEFSEVKAGLANQPNDILANAIFDVLERVDCNKGFELYTVDSNPRHLAGEPGWLVLDGTGKYNVWFNSSPSKAGVQGRIISGTKSELYEKYIFPNLDIELNKIKGDVKPFLSQNQETDVGSLPVTERKNALHGTTLELDVLNGYSSVEDVLADGGVDIFSYTAFYDGPKTLPKIQSSIAEVEDRLQAYLESYAEIKREGFMAITDFDLSIAGEKPEQALSTALSLRKNHITSALLELSSLRLAANEIESPDDLFASDKSITPKQIGQAFVNYWLSDSDADIEDKLKQIHRTASRISSEIANGNGVATSRINVPEVDASIWGSGKSRSPVLVGEDFYVGTGQVYATTTAGSSISGLRVIPVTRWPESLGTVGGYSGSGSETKDCIKRNGVGFQIVSKNKHYVGVEKVNLYPASQTVYETIAKAAKDALKEHYGIELEVKESDEASEEFGLIAAQLGKILEVKGDSVELEGEHRAFVTLQGDDYKVSVEGLELNFANTSGAARFCYWAAGSRSVLAQTKSIKQDAGLEHVIKAKVTAYNIPVFQGLAQKKKNQDVQDLFVTSSDNNLSKQAVAAIDQEFKQLIEKLYSAETTEAIETGEALQALDRAKAMIEIGRDSGPALIKPQEDKYDLALTTLIGLVVTAKNIGSRQAFIKYDGGAVSIRRQGGLLGVSYLQGDESDKVQSFIYDLDASAYLGGTLIANQGVIESIDSAIDLSTVAYDSSLWEAPKPVIDPETTPEEMEEASESVGSSYNYAEEMAAEKPEIKQEPKEIYEPRQIFQAINFFAPGSHENLPALLTGIVNSKHIMAHPLGDAGNMVLKAADALHYAIQSEQFTPDVADNLQKMDRLDGEDFLVSLIRLPSTRQAADYVEQVTTWYEDYADQERVTEQIAKESNIAAWVQKLEERLIELEGGNISGPASIVAARKKLDNLHSALISPATLDKSEVLEVEKEINALNVEAEKAITPVPAKRPKQPSMPDPEKPTPVQQASTPSAQDLVLAKVKAMAESSDGTRTIIFKMTGNEKYESVIFGVKQYRQPESGELFQGWFAIAPSGKFARLGVAQTDQLRKEMAAGYQREVLFDMGETALAPVAVSSAGMGVS